MLMKVYGHPTIPVCMQTSYIRTRVLVYVQLVVFLCLAIMRDWNCSQKAKLLMNGKPSPPMDPVLENALRAVNFDAA